MKKSLIALAVLAAAGTASAQSSVTLFGIVDATVQRLSNSGGQSVTRLHNSGYNSSRLGFRGTEDLGGGMSASFWLEAGMNNDDGSGQVTATNNQGATTGGGGLTFNRRSTVSLAGGWGELRLGRDYTPQFWNLTIFDPFGTNGVGTTQTLNGNGSVTIGGGPVGIAPISSFPTAVRASNSIGYFLPARLGGFYGQIQHWRGEVASPLTAAVAATGATADSGNGWGFRVGYAAGPVNVALGHGRSEFAILGANTDTRQTNVGAQWDFGIAKLMGQITRDELGGLEGRGWLLGGLMPVGAGEIRLAFSQYETELGGIVADARSRKLAVGYVHNLSKRTAVYTTYARVRNNGSANAPVAAGAGNPALGGSSTGFDLGVRHSF